MQSLGSLCHGRDNNFNLLRFGAAATVILSHSILLSGQVTSAIAWILGYFAVNCFFVISGFLVCRSLLLRSNLKHYAISRALRIYPGLIIAVLISVFGFGMVLTTMEPSLFLDHWQTRQFLFHNSLLAIGEVEVYLPGLFLTNPMTGQVNAPLWTLQYELGMYILVALIFVGARLFGKENYQKIFCTLIYTLALISMLAYLANISQQSATISVVANISRFCAMFFMGATYYLLRDKIPMGTMVAILLTGLILASNSIRPLFVTITYLSIGYLLLYLAYIPAGWLRTFNRVGDYSYGMYVLAFPVQQMLVQQWPQIGAPGLFAASMLVTVPAAMLSWHLIEKPCLRLKPGRSDPTKS